MGSKQEQILQPGTVEPLERGAKVLQNALHIGPHIRILARLGLVDRLLGMALSPTASVPPRPAPARSACPSPGTSPSRGWGGGGAGAGALARAREQCPLPRMPVTG